METTKRKNINTTDGFTLLEVITAGFIITFITIFIFVLRTTTGENQAIVWREYLNISEAGSITKTISRELRNARAAQTGAYPLEIAQDNQLVFYSDIDYDTQAERVRYTLTGETLEKGVTEPSGFPVVYILTNEKKITLSESVTNGVTPLFSYYNQNWPLSQQGNPIPLATRLSDTRIVKVYLSINTQEDNSDTVITTHIQIRMLKDNL